MTLRTVVLDQIRTVAAEHDKSLPLLADDLALVDSGLDSLCFAILIARLEDITGRDPFAKSAGQRYPQTLGELVAFYEDAVV